MQQSHIKKIIANHLDPFIGQSLIKARITHWIEGAKMGNQYLPPIGFFGEYGSGKSAFLKATGRILKEVFPEKAENAKFWERGQNIGSLTSFMEDYAIPYVHDQHGLALLDESHEIEKPVALRLRDFWQPNITADATVVRHGDSEITVDPKKWTMLFASSNWEKFPESLRSRVTPLMMETYSDEEMENILFQGLEKVGLKFHENSLAILAASSRGTARSVVDVVQDALKMAKRKGKDSLNKSDVDELLKVRNMFPLGLNKREVDTLLMIESEPKQLQAIAARNGLDSAGQKVLDHYLMKRELMEVRGKRQLTTLGHQYLQELRKRHFIGAKKLLTNAF